MDFIKHNTPHNPTFRCLVIIIDANIRSCLAEFLADSNVPLYYQMHGIGTANSDFLNLCGLGDTNKAIMVCFVPKHRTRMLLAEMNQALQLHKKGTGIAISIPLSGVQGWLYKLLSTTDPEQSELGFEHEVKKMSETITHAMILVTAKQGYSDDIMRTARAAGATGGTILKGLRCSPAEVATHFGISLQDEQEIVAIVVPKEKKNEIMTAISNQHGINTPAQGIVLSLPVDAIMGL